MLAKTTHVPQDDTGPSATMEPLRGVPPLVTNFARNELIWFPAKGVGYLPLTGDAPYDEEYFARYDAQAKTPIGRALMAARVDLVKRIHRGELVDIGIGSGAFIEAARAAKIPAYGYDVNPAGHRWLMERGLWIEPYLTPVDAISCWDVLEHIPNFAPLLRQVRRYVFVSIPIFRNVEHVLKSKHFRPDEHCWYFTASGLEYVFLEHGFKLIEANTMETDLGREDIGTFVFMRR